jgi:L-ascorbate metabolism protein UlaG (beta-lactamase superfamily)
MTEQTLYHLKEEVYFEPLFNGWSAWPSLIAPIQAARYTTATHLRLMKSFIKNHQLHIAASKQIVGGDFLYSGMAQLPEIKRIVETTESGHADLIELSEAVGELNELLRAHKSGESIEPLYEKIPGPLKGYVELVMDMDHKASFRIFESLVYHSKYYKESLQSASFGLMSNVEERPFVLSTPRTVDENHLQLKLPFNTEDLKKILAARTSPLPMAEIDRIFADNLCAGGLGYKSLFTTEPSQYAYQPITEGVRVLYTGHAGFLLETPDVTIMIDPVIATRDHKNPQYMTSFNELPPKIDFICITHSHQDHFQLETLLQLRHKTEAILVPKSNSGVLCDPSLKLVLKQLDFKGVTELEDLETISIPGGSITTLPFMGEHGDLNIRSKCAWLIQLQGKKIFLAADATCLDEHVYRNLHQVIGDVDCLAIGMECVGAPYTWIYGALYPEKVPRNIKESRRLNGCNSDQAAMMVNIFNPRQVYIYALGFETCYKYFMGIEYSEDSVQIVESTKLIDECKKLDIPATKLIGSQEVKIFY